MHSTLLTFALLALASPAPGAPRVPSGAAPAVAQDGGLEAFLDRELARATERRAAGEPLWASALALREAADALEAAGHGGPPLDALLDRRLGAGLEGEALLLAAAARAAGVEPDAAKLVELLLPIATSADANLAERAADLMSKPALRRIERESRATTAQALLVVARDGARAPGLRIHAARAAYSLGGGAEKRSARGELLAYLRSSDASLRALAALALAETGEELVGDLESELERLASLPGPQGELADAYLRAESAKRLRDRKLEDLRRQQDGNVLPEDLRRVTSVLELVEERHLEGDLVDRSELIDAGLSGLLRYLDDHSAYLSPEAFASFQQDLEAEYGGIGAFVGEDREDGLFTITRPIYSGPAYRAGLQSDDKIVRVDDWPTLGQPTEEVIKRLKGQPGTKVRLYIWRRGMPPELIDRPTAEMMVEVERAQIEIPAVHSQMLPGGVGLIELSGFSRVASSEMREALAELQRQGMRALIFDLRTNAGGLLTEAVDVADLFLPPNKLVVTTEFRTQEPERHYTRREPAIPLDMPMAVLIGRFSASASEIVAGALQDHERATLVGDRSFGKGSVQNLIRLPGFQDDDFKDENRNGRYEPWEQLTRDYDGDGEFDFAPRVKLTIARYLLPSGRSIHREFDRDRNVISEGGVAPEIKVPLPRLDGWEITERRRLIDELHVRKYVEMWFGDDPERALRLAESDGRDASQYPGFDAFYTGLSTKLDRDSVRQLVRAELRRRVQDLRGGEWPFGDFQEDPQVQAAIRAVLAPLGVEPGSVEAFRATFLPESDPVGGDTPVATLDASQRAALAGAIDSLRAARDAQGRISEDELERVLDLLGRLDR